MTILPDLLAPHLKLVFCGTAASTLSAQRGAYYANPGNKFWRTLYSVGLTPVQFAPEQFRELLAYGIGLTDLAQHVSGMDHTISKEAFDPQGFEQRILAVQPRVVAFTSKRGAAEYLGRSTKSIAYGWQEETIGETRIFVLPSPSGAATSFWDEGQWQRLADDLKSEPDEERQR